MKTKASMCKAVRVSSDIINYIGGKDGEYVSARELSRSFEVPVSQTITLLSHLSKHGYVRYTSGLKGGFKLNKPAYLIAESDIKRSFESLFFQGKCLLGVSKCDGKRCIADAPESPETSVAPESANARESYPSRMSGLRKDLADRDGLSITNPESKVKPVILVVDDERFVLKAAERIFDSAGFEVHTCEMWGEVASTIRRARPDLVLLDYNMPSLDGGEICKILKRDSDSELLVYLFSAEEGNVLNDIVGRCGADGYVSKNLQPPQLVESIHGILDGENGGGVPAR